MSKLKYPKHLKREASAFRAMHRRVLEPKHKDFPRYGGRGIQICPQWLRNWPQFILDMGPAPSPAHWLGRTDVKLGYTPENVIWTLPTPQKRRRAYCHKVTWLGMTLTPMEWEQKLGMPQNLLLNRIYHGMDQERAMHPERFRDYRPRSSTNQKIQKQE